MKTLIALTMLLAGNCWGQTQDFYWATCNNIMILELSANRVIAHVTRETVTNRVHAKQYLASFIRPSEWKDVEHPSSQFYGHPEDRERDNPDKRIVEVREIVRATLDWKGKPFTVELENNLLRRWEERRIVEPPTPVIDRWEAGPVQTNFTAYTAVTNISGVNWVTSSTNLWIDATNRAVTVEIKEEK